MWSTQMGVLLMGTWRFNDFIPSRISIGGHLILI